MRDSLVADGCTIAEGTTIENSIIGLRCRIGRNVTIRHSILMGNDYYDPPSESTAAPAERKPPLGIGDHTVIEGAIIDKNCSIGHHVRVVNHQKVIDSEEQGCMMICDGIPLVSKGGVLPDHWTL